MIEDSAPGPAQFFRSASAGLAAVVCVEVSAMLIGTIVPKNLRLLTVTSLASVFLAALVIRLVRDGLPEAASSDADEATWRSRTATGMLVLVSFSSWTILEQVGMAWVAVLPAVCVGYVLLMPAAWLVSRQRWDRKLDRDTSSNHLPRDPRRI